jgi:hypothetical protein
MVRIKTTKKFTYNLGIEQMKRIEALALKMLMSKSVLIRRAVDEYLEKYE